MKASAVLLLCLICSLSLFLVCVPDNKLHFYACDVGQGDAMLFVYKNKQVVIDGGRDSKALGCIKKILPVWDTNLELVIATHADADHIGGLDDIISAYTVSTFFVPQQSKETNDFADFNQTVSRKRAEGTIIHVPRAGDTIEIATGITVQVVSHLGVHTAADSAEDPKGETQLWDVKKNKQEKKVSNNDGSIVVYLTYNKMSFLMTGDLETAGEQALLHGGLIKEAAILKVGHHGSKSSSSNEFLKRVRPEFAVISVGKNNRYGHPHPQTEERLQSVGAKILRTDTHGTVHITSDGTSVKEAILMPWYK